MMFLILAAMAAMSAGLTGWGLHSQRRLVEDEFRLRRLVLLRTFMHVAALSIEKGDHALVAGYMRSLLADPDVDQAAFLDPKGAPLAVKLRESDPDAQVLDVDAGLFKKALASFVPQFQELIVGGHRHEAVYQRAWAETSQGIRTLGVCYLRQDRYRIDAQLRATGRAFAAIALAIMLAVALPAVYFGNRLVKPIEALRAAAEGMRNDRTDVPLSLEGIDEIGDLARSFVAMRAEVQSRRKSLEEAFRELRETTVSRDYVQSVTKSLLDALVVTGPDGKIVTVNRAAKDLLGYDEAELVGRPMGMLLEDGGGAAAGNPAAGVAEASLKGRGGGKILVLLSTSPLLDAQGRALGTVWLARDLRERKKLEMMLAQSEKLSAVGQIAAGVAHEINNPLGVILGFAQAVLRRLRPDDPLDLPVRSIEREALRCSRLVKNLLTFSRQDSPRLEELDLNEAVLEALTLAEAHAKVRGIEVRRDLAAGRRVSGDRGQIQQIVMNLCSNAVDAIPAERGTVTIRTRDETTAAGPSVVLEVEDDGAGIPEHLRAKIFNPFFTTKEVGKGTGLGLSLVHEIVERHGGTITLRSAVGEGTTFVVTLPVAAGRG